MSLTFHAAREIVNARIVRRIFPLSLRGFVHRYAQVHGNSATFINRCGKVIFLMSDSYSALVFITQSNEIEIREKDI